MFKKNKNTLSVAQASGKEAFPGNGKKGSGTWQHIQAALSPLDVTCWGFSIHAGRKP